MPRSNRPMHESLPGENLGRLPHPARRARWISRVGWQAALAMLALEIMIMGAVLACQSARQPDPRQPDPTWTETVLHRFGLVQGDGAYPPAGLILDSAGNLYGTARFGGSFGNGAVFKLSPSGTETVLYSFAGGPMDGASPVASLILDSVGNLYGTTAVGGASSNCTGGCGVVFKLSPDGTETVLHSFAGGDGANPHASLVLDSAGNLYGTTAVGGTSSNCGGGCGVVFKLSPDGTETVLHSFGGGDGANPSAGFVQDSAGNLYGTTYVGGTSSNCIGGCGVVFKLTSTGALTVLHSFAGGDGANPQASLILDSAGNLYGTTYYGGTSSNCRFGCGVVFKLSPDGTETVLHGFAGVDGAGSGAGVILDSAGNLYGTTAAGGTSSNCGGGCGVVFKLTPAGAFTVLHSFAGDPTDGQAPSAVIQDPAGNLYGTTLLGGGVSVGVVFKLSLAGTV